MNEQDTHKHYSIYNTSTGETVDMRFASEKQMKEWINNSGWVCLGELKTYLPTRHIRMRNKKGD